LESEFRHGGGFSILRDVAVGVVGIILDFQIVEFFTTTLWIFSDISGFRFLEFGRNK